MRPKSFNTLRPRQNGRHFPDDILKCIFLNENGWISIKISLKFVPKGPINNIPALIQIMAWRRPGDKPLSKTMLASSLTHICVTRPQLVNCVARRQWVNKLLAYHTITRYTCIFSLKYCVHIIKLIIRDVLTIHIYLFQQWLGLKSLVLKPKYSIIGRSWVLMPWSSAGMLLHLKGK